MIKRLTHSAVFAPNRSEWPTEDRDSGRYLFEGRVPYRKIVVMVDSELMEESVDLRPDTQRGLMTGLLGHELVAAYRYDATRPLMIQPTDNEESSPRRTQDRELPWVTVGSRVDGIWPVRYMHKSNNLVHTGVSGNAVDLARAATGVNVYDDFDSETAADRRSSDELAAQVASQALGADVFVSERPYLGAPMRDTSGGTTVCSVSEALTILGLYLRAQNRFPVASDINFNRGLFYWVGSRELLSEAWRLVAATSQNGADTGYGKLLALAHSAIQRVARALEVRDDLHVAINRPQNNDTLDMALSSLDVVLSLLMGALDPLARIAHNVLELDGSERWAAWQNNKWLAEVGSASPSLAAVVCPESDHRSALTVLNLLRNSVHGEALRGVTFVEQSLPQSLVSLPLGDRDEVIKAMSALGGADRWGVQTTVSHEILVAPGVLVDRLFTQVVALLNDVMSEMPLERIPNVKLTPTDVEPPAASAAGPLGAFEPSIRQSIRWQLGL